MQVQTVTSSATQAVFHTEDAAIYVTPVTASILRITYAKDTTPRESSLVVVPQEKTEVGFALEENQTDFRLKTAALTLCVDKKTAALRCYNQKGELLAKCPKQTLMPIEVHLPTAEVKAAQAVQTADGLKVKTGESQKVFDRIAYQAKLHFEWEKDEALYGLGSHEEGVFNLRGTSQLLYQQNMKVCVPMLVSTKGYGVLVDCCSAMSFHDDLYGSYLWCDTVYALDYYFIYGENMDGIVKGYRRLTGQVPMLPKAMFGYMQSKERYETQQELLEIAGEFKRRKIPLSVLIQDWQTWEEGKWGQKSFDASRFPDPCALTQKLHHQGVQMLISIWPNMNGNGANQTEMAQNGYLLGNGSTYNAFDPKARALYWKHTNDGLFSMGIDGWWCDCSEPFEADWFGQEKLEPAQRMAINVGEAKKYLDPEYLNAYSLVHSQGIYEGQRGVTDRKRVVNLTRSSFAGQQRYGTIVWSGDIAATWDVLKKQIPAGLNFSLTGNPYWTFDIGGFFVKRDSSQWFRSGDYDDGVADLGYRELYTRWLQLGTFMPVFRSHGTDTPREPWQFGEEGEIFYDTIVKFIRLRYQLMPYLYHVAAAVSFEDASMLRALVFDFAADEKTHEIADEFMLGESLLVCPVLEPMYYATHSQPIADHAKTRAVYLPKGCGWYDFWTGVYYEGGTSLQAKADLETIPLYVRAGTILPMADQAQQPDQITLRIYRGCDAKITLYEDDGESYDYEKGMSSSVAIAYHDQSGELLFHNREGSYKQGPILFLIKDETGKLLDQGVYDGVAMRHSN